MAKLVTTHTKTVSSSTVFDVALRNPLVPVIAVAVVAFIIYRLLKSEKEKEFSLPPGEKLLDQILRNHFSALLKVYFSRKKGILYYRGLTVGDVTVSMTAHPKQAFGEEDGEKAKAKELFIFGIRESLLPPRHMFILVPRDKVRIVRHAYIVDDIVIEPLTENVFVALSKDVFSYVEWVFNKHVLASAMGDMAEWQRKLYSYWNPRLAGQIELYRIYSELMAEMERKRRLIKS